MGGWGSAVEYRNHIITSSFGDTLLPLINYALNLSAVTFPLLFLNVATKEQRRQSLMPRARYLFHHQIWNGS